MPLLVHVICRRLDSIECDCASMPLETSQKKNQLPCSDPSFHLGNTSDIHGYLKVPGTRCRKTQCCPFHLFSETQWLKKQSFVIWYVCNLVAKQLYICVSVSDCFVSFGISLHGVLIYHILLCVVAVYVLLPKSIAPASSWRILRFGVSGPHKRGALAHASGTW